MLSGKLPEDFLSAQRRLDMPRLTAHGWRWIAWLDLLFGDRWPGWLLAGAKVSGLRTGIGLLALLAVVLLAPVASFGADIDEAKLASFGPGGLLRWENVRGAPYWIAGAPLTFDTSLQLYVARLQPGQDTLVHIPSGSLLRAVPVRAALCPQDVLMWVSNGSGLYRAALSAINSDGSLLLAPGDLETSLIRIERPSNATTCVDVALFVSRRMVPEEAFPYPCEWVGCGPAVSLSSDESAVENYQHLMAGQSANFKSRPPHDFALKAGLSIRLWSQSLIRSTS